MRTQNIFGKRDSALVDVLVENRHIKIERIIAKGQVSPDGVVCEQPAFDALILLRGELTLEYENEAGKVSLKPGDVITTEPGQANRVDHTSRAGETVWVKFSFQGPLEEGGRPGPNLFERKDRRFKSIFPETPAVLPLVETPDVRIDSIVTRGERSGKDVDLVQRDNGCLLLLKGQAVVSVGGEKGRMAPGDYVIIGPETERSVEWTSPDEETVWVVAGFSGELGKDRYPLFTGY
ncbi:hypothetical protein [Nonomuraea lactucae]|uniref:hypothetical protein n=1 Tax=Nonomuraea lactucae TaxID=2249762 RepID=UPI0013B42146|nr:hypothetical protein [Nonomuraea lactucae]